MSIKSWFVSLGKKLDEKSANDTIQTMKSNRIRTIRLDEDMNYSLITDEGVTRESKSFSDKFKDPRMEKYKKDFYDLTVQEHDELFGPHRQCVENGKVVLVWDVK